MDVSCVCPACEVSNRVSGAALLTNDEAGAELWGRCANCQGEFQLDWSEPASGGLDIAGYRTPVVTTVLYRLSCPT